MGIATTLRDASVKLITTVRGNRLAILGAKAVGKTSLHTYLREGLIVKDYDATGLSRNVPLGIHSAINYGLYIKKGEDVGGSEDFREIWRKIFLNSDICFYLFNSQDIQLGKKAIFHLIGYHLYLIKYWNDNFRKSKVPILVIGSFADLLPGQNTLIEYENDLYSKLKSHLEKGNVQRQNFLIGSLSNQKNAAFLLEHIVRALEITK